MKLISIPEQSNRMELFKESPVKQFMWETVRLGSINFRSESIRFGQD